MPIQRPDSPPTVSPTLQQRRALETRHTSVVLSSGAGCGKTYVLTERYLSHLEKDGAEVGQVVAITFTDRAARQMRGRIRKAVEGRVKDLECPDPDAWARHLRNLETAPISTIHAFCAALLRQHAVEAGVDPRFDVLEEVLSVNLEREALHSCLQRLLTARDGPGEDLRQLVLLYGWRPVVETVGSLVRARDERRWREWLDAPADRLAAEGCDFARRVLLPRRLAHLLAARPRLSRCLELLRRSPPLPGPMADNVRRLMDELPRLAEAPDLGAAVDEFRELAKVGHVGKKAWPDRAVYEPIKAALEKLRTEFDGWDLSCFEATAEEVKPAVEVGRRWLRVAREAVKEYRERKRSHGVLDFQDLLAAARDLVCENAAVRARLRDRYRFLLIDELQDTDPVQMELVEALCGPSVTAGKLFAVGDANQSIYRFRGADVRGFLDLGDKMPEEGRQELTRNYRSQPAILHFANALFDGPLKPYARLEAHHSQLNAGPCVEFLWRPRTADGDDGKASAAEGRRVEAEWIARRVAALVRGGAEIVRDPRDEPKRLRPVRAGDVVLLFRAMSNVALYEAALRRNGLDYYLVGGRAFYAQQEIYDLLNLLRALENPQDGVSLAGVLRSPFCCVSDEALFVLGRRRDGLWAGLCDEASDARLPSDQRGPVARARRHLQKWRGLKDRLPIARLLGAVFADSGYDAATQLEPLGDRKLANLWKLQELARTFDRSGLFGLAEFIARLGDFVRTQAREGQAATLPEESDVVRLMTIHQAKGLEFPVVVVPDLAATGHGGGPPSAVWDRALGAVARPPVEDEAPAFCDAPWKWFQAQSGLEEWQEDLRTLYVACTRAEDYLILSGSLPGDYQPEGPWMQTLAERFDLKTGECRASDLDSDKRPAVTVGDQPPPKPAPDRPKAGGASADELPAPVVPLAPAAQRRFVEVADLLGRPAPPRRERVLRDVLAGWDFREPEGWRPLLSGFGRSDNDLEDLERMLKDFADSDTRRRLAAGHVCQHDAEYILRVAPGEAMVGGRIDCLWQDADGGRRLLFFTTAPAAKREQAWQERLTEIVLASEAVRRQTGRRTAGVTLHSLADGFVVERSTSRLPYVRVLAAVAGLLKQGRS